MLSCICAFLYQAAITVTETIAAESTLFSFKTNIEMIYEQSPTWNSTNRMWGQSEASYIVLKMAELC